MRRRKAFLKITISLVIINSISIYIYLSFQENLNHFLFNSQLNDTNSFSHKKPSHERSPSSLNRRKPWPVLPSFLPWSLNPNVRTHSCEGYFGNGFNRRTDLLRSRKIHTKRRSNYGDGSGGGWFRCFYSETLESSICEGGSIKMNPNRIRMSNGGEDLQLVIGRDEEEELPAFDSGAFEIEVDQNETGKKLVNQEFLDRFVPQGAIGKHTMRNLIDSIRTLSSNEFNCSQWIEEPTLLVTRFEYANLFHTVTDWYSAYVASRVTGLPSRPHLVFVDGHCKAQLEETWEALFSSLKYAKNFSTSVCFRHAILSPLGYETALFKGLSEVINCRGIQAQNLSQNADDQKTARLTEFGEMIRASFGFPVDKNREEKRISEYNILFVRREDYLAHPRHGGKVESRLSNEQEVFNSLKNWIDDNLKCNITLVNGLFAHMSMKEQVSAIQEASVIIGAHGAGLTHIIAAKPNTVILEIISSFFRRPHFALISQWRGLEYYAINLDGSYAHPEVVIDKLSAIMKSLGCR